MIAMDERPWSWVLDTLGLLVVVCVVSGAVSALLWWAS